jgi:hypothetical protein
MSSDYQFLKKTSTVGYEVVVYLLDKIIKVICNITRGVEDANYIGRKLKEEYEKWGLKIIYVKTEYLGTDHTKDLQVNGNIIPTVKQFKYLGSIVQDNGLSDLEIEKKKICETRRVISC